MKKRIIGVMLVIIIALAITLALSACNSGEFTRENIDQLRPGMSQRDVERLVGNNHTGSNTTVSGTLTWAYGQNTMLLSFSGIGELMAGSMLVWDTNTYWLTASGWGRGAEFTKDRIGQIRIGMIRRDVENLVGDDSTGIITIGTGVLTWTEDENTLILSFIDGAVVAIGSSLVWDENTYWLTANGWQRIGGFSREYIDQIRPNMTQRQVENLIGSDYTTLGNGILAWMDGANSLMLVFVDGGVAAVVSALVWAEETYWLTASGWVKG